MVFPIGSPTFDASESNAAAMLKPWSAKIVELAIAWPSRPPPKSAMLCWPWVRRILRISAMQDFDVVADAALAELAEPGEVAADLGRVDVRVLADLLRGDPVLAHLLGLDEHPEVPAQARRDAHGQPLAGRAPSLACDLMAMRDRITTAAASAGITQYPSRRSAPRRRRQTVRVDEVGERLLPVDLDDRDALAVRALELWIACDVDLLELEPDLGAHGGRSRARRSRRGGSPRRGRGSPGAGGRHRVMVKTASAVDGWAPSSPSTGCARRRRT